MTITDCMNGLDSVNRNKHNCLNGSGHFQKPGTPARKGAQSIVKLAQRLTGNLLQLPSRASVAVQSFFQRSWAALTSFVQTNASQRTAVSLGLTMSNEHAGTVGSNSLPTSIPSKKIALGRVLTVREAGAAERVYDLTVEGQHEFFANGILVHNCIDALRYACEGARRASKSAKSEPIKYRNNGVI